jgi:hypothetical protein
VIDLKIGPSPHIHDYPEMPFTQSFVSTSRAGGMAGGVENQIMGSFDESQRKLYAAAFEKQAALIGRQSGGALTKKNAEEVFGPITGAHSKSHGGTGGTAPFGNKTRREGGADLTGLYRPSFEFEELHDILEDFEPVTGECKWRGKPQNNTGPFRVYQEAGFFNWKQGESVIPALKNKLSVANTLTREHSTKSEKPREPFHTNTEFYSKRVQPAALDAIKSLTEDAFGNLKKMKDESEKKEAESLKKKEIESLVKNPNNMEG